MPCSAPAGALGPLHGVPLAHKDMYYRAGKRSTCGSKIRADFRPSYTATVIERLEGAGSISIGGLNMAEFAQNATGHNQHYGHCGNPWNADYCPGGSSSGSGASVGARLVYAALGSDTGGSIRLPASLCGVTGIKGTQTRVSRYGVMPLSFSADNVGPLARSARDCARIMSVIAGHDPRDPTSSSEPVPDYEAALDRRHSRHQGRRADELLSRRCRSGRHGGVRERRGGAEAASARCIVSGHHSAYGCGCDLWLDPVSRVEGATIHAQWMRERPQDYAIHLNARLYASYGIPATIYVEALSRRGDPEGGRRRRCSARSTSFIVPTIRIKAPTLKQTDVDAGARRRDRVLQQALGQHAADELPRPAFGQPALRARFERHADRTPDPGRGRSRKARS